ncbi:hypothetical protein Pmar_PMAR017481 [Perkinsus marinus ATCC 50983]|uniref:Uncharacterized protein n=1 Tax=Perkinsus marinus (strain ATCC 50983 / TXsc) TaxID=423536 RepID=C5KG29_PERM5|nr:hypothetical protein Pmar_PMAR017481 [Perkinsus marinus ATCC 50983]EER16593.1 hypothetical protein Pmar_PMAR017481 [Perkinsus marinus ATCC 50983]|eukprot:XP_002784797.1 hypothetical protein Pmar_PMAR017481 [Perkinsus marinus ATCC 50983]
MIGVSIAVIYLIVFAHAEALLVNDTFISLDEGHQLRSLRLPVIHERPPNCLPPAVQFGDKDYCWFNLENAARTDRHAGLLVLSNGAHRNSYSTLELQVLWANSKPYDIGVWAAGNTFRHIDLDDGLKLDLQVSVPTVSRSGGKDDDGKKTIEFDVVLSTAVSVPHVGVIRASDKTTAFATLDLGKEGIDARASLRLFSEVNKKAPGVDYVITFEVTIATYNGKFVWWIYQCLVDVDIKYKKDGKDVDYKKNIIIFRETSKR